MKDNRPSRGETYVKPFKPIIMDKLSPSRVKESLKLQVQEINGE